MPNNVFLSISQSLLKVEGDTAATEGLSLMKHKEPPEAGAAGEEQRAKREGTVHPDIERLCEIIKTAPHLKVLGGDVQRRHIRGDNRRDGHSGHALSASIPACSINAASMTQLLDVLLNTDNDIQYMNMNDPMSHELSFKQVALTAVQAAPCYHRWSACVVSLAATRAVCSVHPSGTPFLPTTTMASCNVCQSPHTRMCTDSHS